MKKAEYKVIVSEKGFEDFERKVAEKLNEGWKPVGGITFNHSFPHQALARVIEAMEQPEKESKTVNEQGKAQKVLTANEAMRRIDDLT